MNTTSSSPAARIPRYHRLPLWNEVDLTSRGCLDPFRALKPFPILTSSKFVPKRVSNSEGVTFKKESQVEKGGKTRVETEGKTKSPTAQATPTSPNELYSLVYITSFPFGMWSALKSRGVAS